MKKSDYAFSNSWDSKGFTKFEYICIEMMKASIIADNNTSPENRKTNTIFSHADDAVRMARALCDRLEREEGR